MQNKINYINLWLVEDSNYKGGYFVHYLNDKGLSMIGRTDTLEGLKELIDTENTKRKLERSNES